MRKENLLLRIEGFPSHNEEGKPSILKRSPSFLVPLELRIPEEEKISLERGGDDKKLSDRS